MKKLHLGALQKQKSQGLDLIGRLCVSCTKVPLSSIVISLDLQYCFASCHPGPHSEFLNVPYDFVCSVAPLVLSA